MTKFFFRKEFARLAGMSTGLLDYYENIGLTKSDRRLGRNNLYSEKVLREFREALLLRKQGILIRRGQPLLRAATAARFLGCSRQLISYYVRARRLVPTLEEKGCAWYNISSLQALAEGAYEIEVSGGFRADRASKEFGSKGI